MKKKTTYTPETIKRAYDTVAHLIDNTIGDLGGLSQGENGETDEHKLENDYIVYVILPNLLRKAGHSKAYIVENQRVMHIVREEEIYKNLCIARLASFTASLLNSSVWSCASIMIDRS